MVCFFAAFSPRAYNTIWIFFFVALLFGGSHVQRQNKNILSFLYHGASVQHTRAQQAVKASYAPCPYSTCLTSCVGFPTAEIVRRQQEKKKVLYSVVARVCSVRRALETCLGHLCSFRQIFLLRPHNRNNRVEKPFFCLTFRGKNRSPY